MRVANNAEFTMRNVRGRGTVNSKVATVPTRKIADSASNDFVVDIRIYIIVITLAMAGSFMLGVGFGPPVVLSSPSSLLNAGMLLAVRDQSWAAAVPESDLEAFTLSGATNISNEIDRPSGQHLMVDMEGVDSAFLDSEELLSRAMVETVAESGLTMLSYHCHTLKPAGVSCVGVLLESHISFHTWPEDGVITLDLFSCGANPLLPVVSTIQRLFGIGNPETIRSHWSHELRGFRPDDEKRKNYLDDSSDLTLWVLSPIDIYSKKQIHSSLTKYQRVDIWDVVKVNQGLSEEDVFQRNMSSDDTRLELPEFLSPNRILFLDGIVQSVGSNERVYHEALVHPAMFAHPYPKQVVILGGGEGATLREVLKHRTVEQVVMIEIDEELVPIMREHLPALNNCSDLIGRTSNCFDDPLVNLTFEDGRKWFLERYGTSPIVEPPAEPVDVIILDALDPEDDTEMSGNLYNDRDFISSLIKSLSPEGVLVIQIGTAATIYDPRPDFGIYKNRETLFHLLEANEDVQALLIYEEEHCGFFEPHSFLIACKSVDCRSRWYARSDQIDYQIYDRIVSTRSRQPALVFYDGTTQHAYQWPKKGWEAIYCRREPTPFECAYRHLNFSAKIFEFELDAKDEDRFFTVEVKTDENGKEESFVHAAVDMPKGSYIMPGHLASSLEVSSRNMDGLKSNVNVGGGRVAVIEDLLDVFKDYAHESSALGSANNYVEVGASVLIRRVEDSSEANVETWLPRHPSGERPKFSPVYERHRVSFDLFMVASKNIRKGEEIKMHKKMWHQQPWGPLGEER